MTERSLQGERTRVSPQRWQLILSLYAFRLAMSWLVALPIVGSLACCGLEHQPTGDGVLFEPGGLYLLETLRLSQPALTAALPGALLLFVIGCVLGVLPQGVVVNGVAQPGAGYRAWVQHAVRSFPRFSLLGGLGFLAQALALIIALLGAHAARQWLGGPEQALVGDAAYVLVLMLACCSLAGIGILVDLARMASTNCPDSIPECIESGLQTLLRRPIVISLRFVLPQLTTLGVAIGVGFWVGALGVEQGAALRLAAIAGLHQMVVLISCAAELYWQERAWSFVQQATPRELTAFAAVDTTFDSVEPRDPN